MPTLSLTLSAAAVTEINDAFASLYGYQAMINGAPNPETKAQFARRMVIVLVKDRVLTYRAQQAAKTASTVDPDIT